MTATKEQIFQFSDLDALWERVRELSQTRYLPVRCIGQLAAGAIAQIRNDPRFDAFDASVAKALRPGEGHDLSVFRIYRKPIRRARRVRIAQFESVN